jgi:hypothetical protein
MNPFKFSDLSPFKNVCPFNMNLFNNFRCVSL